MNRRTRSVVPSLAAAALVAILLAGCSAAAATGGGAAKRSGSSPSASASASSTPSASTTPTVNPTDAVNATTVLPPDFPPQVPLIDGDILTASKTSSGWVVWISSTDPISDFQQASGSLQDAGFTASADQSINGSAGGVFTDDRFTVTVTAGADAKYQNAVGYEVDTK